MESVLIVDRDRERRGLWVSKLQKAYRVVAAADEEEALLFLSERLFSLVVMEGPRLSLVNFCRSLPRSPAILDLTQPPLPSAVAAGSEWPAGILDSVREALKNVAMKPSAQLPAVESPIIGNSPAIQRVFRLLDRVAKSDLTLLLVGETGVGKELFAQEIHRRSARAGKPFLAVNGAALPLEMAESELFGHERGAFTDAHRLHRGYFERANTGTLFLDEVGELPFWLQVKLLRVLETRSFERLGGEELVRTDVRFLAATHQNLPTLVAQGRFRTDLFYRLQGVQIVIPPLRERAEDMPLLVHYFLQSESNPCRFDEATLRLLQRYPWPGNVRELKNFCQYMALLYPGEVVTPDRLEPRFFCAEPARDTLENFHGANAGPLPVNSMEMGDFDASALPIPLSSSANAAAVNAEFPTDALRNALRVTGGNRARAAKILGISRSTFYRRLRVRNNI